MITVVVMATSIASLLLLKLPSSILEVYFMLTCFQNSIVFFIKTSVHKKIHYHHQILPFIRKFDNNHWNKREQPCPN